MSWKLKGLSDLLPSHMSPDAENRRECASSNCRGGAESGSGEGSGEGRVLFISRMNISLVFS